MTIELSSLPAASPVAPEDPAGAFRLAGADVEGGHAVVVGTASGVYRLGDPLPAGGAPAPHLDELLAHPPRWGPLLEARAGAAARPAPPPVPTPRAAPPPPAEP